MIEATYVLTIDDLKEAGKIKDTAMICRLHVSACNGSQSESD